MYIFPFLIILGQDAGPDPYGESSESESKFTAIKRILHGCARFVYSMLPSIRTPETKTQFLRHPSQFSVNEVFRIKAEHFSFKMKVLAI